MRRSIVSLVLAFTMVFTSIQVNGSQAFAVGDVDLSIVELENQQAKNKEALENARESLAAFTSQSNSIKAQLDRLLEDDVEMQESYDRLTSELNLAMDELTRNIRLYEDAELQAIEMQALYETRITTLFKYRNRSTFEVLLASDSLNGFFLNLRLMSYIASSDQKMLKELKISQADAAIARDNAREVVAQADDYFNYLKEQLNRLRSDIDLIESDLASLDQAILNRSSMIQDLEYEDEYMNSELKAFYQLMAEMEEAEEARLALESQRIEDEAAEEAAGPEPTPEATSEAVTSEEESITTTTREESLTTERETKTVSETSSTREETTKETTTRETTTRETTTKATTTESTTKATTKAPTTTTTMSTTKAPTTAPPTTTEPTTTAQVTTVELTTTTEVTSPPTTTVPPTEAPASNKMMFPVPGYYSVSSHFGYRVHPINGLPNSFHYGTDFAAPAGTPIRAAFEGTVVLVDKTWQGQTYTSHRTGHGNFVMLQHANGITTLYAHMKDVTVSVGQVVKQGDYIGTVGSTGASTGPHLHLELAIYGTRVNAMGSDYLGNGAAIR